MAREGPVDVYGRLVAITMRRKRDVSRPRTAHAVFRERCVCTKLVQERFLGTFWRWQLQC